MTIIQSTQGYLFGGYVNAAWDSSDNFANDHRAFLFTLINPHAIPPTRYLIMSGQEQYAILNYKQYGPTFGGGFDINMPSKSNKTNGAIGFPHTYTDTTEKGSSTFTGSYLFLTSEIEVYKLTG